MFQIGLLDELAPTIGALHHRIISIIVIGSLIECFDLLQSPIHLIINHLQLLLRKLRWLLPVPFGLLLLIHDKLVGALWVVNFKTRQSEIPSTYTTCIRGTVHVRVRGFLKVSDASGFLDGSPCMLVSIYFYIQED